MTLTTNGTFGMWQCLQAGGKPHKIKTPGQGREVPDQPTNKLFWPHGVLTDRASAASYRLPDWGCRGAR